MFTPILCLALAFADPPVAELVTRSYDLRSLSPARPADLPALLVTPIDPGTGSLEIEGAESSCFEPEHVVDLVRTVVSPDEWEAPGRALDLVGDGGRTLMVSAPEAIHREIERFLEFLTGAFASSITVRVDVYRTDGGDPLANPGRAKLVQTFRTALRSGTPAVLRAEKLVPFVRDFDVEIAEGAARHDAILDRYSLGTVGEISAERGRQGDVLVSFVIRHAWEREKSEELDLDLFHEFRTDNAVSEVSAGGLIDSPHVGFATIAGSARLTEGRSAHAYVAVRPGSGGVLVDVTLEKAPALARKFECGDRDLVIVDVAGDVSRGFRAPDHEAWQLARPNSEGMPVEFVLPPIRVSGFESEGSDRMNDAFMRAEVEESVFAAHAIQHWMVCCAARGAAEPAMNAGLAALATQRDCPPLVIDLSDRADGKPERLAMLPAAVGHAFALAGTQSTFVLDYEVEVANNASTIDPVVRALVDGLAIWSRSSATSGAVHFDVQTKVSLLDSNPRRQERRSHLNGPLDMPRLVTSFIDRGVDLPASRARDGVELGTLSLPEDRQGTLTVVPLANE